MTRLLRRFLPIWVLAAAASAEPLPAVEIQPLGPVRQEDILSLTTRDIPTTTGKGDSGIMGWVQIGGRACVAPTFRLRKGKAGDALFSAGLVKVANHELGHTRGRVIAGARAASCRTRRGKITTMDGESGKPCEKCSDQLPLKE